MDTLNTDCLLYLIEYLGKASFRLSQTSKQFNQLINYVYKNYKARIDIRHFGNESKSDKSELWRRRYYFSDTVRLLPCWHSRTLDYNHTLILTLDGSKNGLEDYYEFRYIKNAFKKNKCSKIELFNAVTLRIQNVTFHYDSILNFTDCNYDKKLKGIVVSGTIVSVKNQKFVEDRNLKSVDKIIFQF